MSDCEAHTVGIDEPNRTHCEKVVAVITIYTNILHMYVITEIALTYACNYVKYCFCSYCVCGVCVCVRVCMYV